MGLPLDSILHPVSPLHWCATLRREISMSFEVRRFVLDFWRNRCCRLKERNDVSLSSHPLIDFDLSLSNLVDVLVWLKLMTFSNF